MSDRRQEVASFTRRMAGDGPPLWIVLGIFIVLQVLTFGPSYPLFGGLALAIGLLIALVVDLVRTPRDRTADGRTSTGLWLRPYATTRVRSDDLRFAKHTYRGEENR